MVMPEFFLVLWW